MLADLRRHLRFLAGFATHRKCVGFKRLFGLFWKLLDLVSKTLFAFRPEYAFLIGLPGIVRDLL